MAQNIKQNEVVTTKALPFHATVSMGEYYDETTREMRSYVSVVLKNPFDDEDFTDVRITPKWRNVKGTFDYSAKKLLRSRDEFEIDGEIKLAQYYSKRKKRKVTYPGMFVQNPFGEGPLEFGVKREEDASVFSMLASAYFKTQLDTESAEEESSFH